MENNPYFIHKYLETRKPCVQINILFNYFVVKFNEKPAWACSTPIGQINQPQYFRRKNQIGVYK